MRSKTRKIDDDLDGLAHYSGSSVRSGDWSSEPLRRPVRLAALARFDDGRSLAVEELVAVRRDGLAGSGAGDAASASSPVNRGSSPPWALARPRPRRRRGRAFFASPPRDIAEELALDGLRVELEVFLEELAADEDLVPERPEHGLGADAEVALEVEHVLVVDAAGPDLLLDDVPDLAGGMRKRAANAWANCSRGG